MVDYIVNNWEGIVSIIIAVSGAATSVVGFIKMLKSEKRAKSSESKMKEDIQITREGIIEAFKKSVVTNDLKVSISKQVDAKLEAWAEKFLTMFKEHEDIRTKLSIANTEILKNTAAYNKLTDEEKAVIDEILKALTEDERTIEV